MRASIYLDNNSTTPMDERVIAAMVNSMRENFGNAASRHEVGARADVAVQGARSAVARLINADPDEIYFMSGATEANNLVVRGAAERRGDRDALIASAIEHPSILEPAMALREIGVAVRLVQPSPEGLVDQECVRDNITPGTFLVTVALANNEIGTINPVRSYSSVTKPLGVLLHSDATQAVGHIQVDVAELGVDFLSFSAHKLHGPKGIGALYAKRKSRRRIEPQIRGGGQERGLRSGTLNVPAIVGFGAAADIARREFVAAEERVKTYRDLLLQLLRAGVPDLVVNGSLTDRLPGNLSVALPGVDAEALVVRLRTTVAFSTGAACSSAKVEPSHVLVALAKDDGRPFSSVRFGIGKQNTEDEIRSVASAVTEQVSILRRLRSA